MLITKFSPEKESGEKTVHDSSTVKTEMNERDKFCTEINEFVGYSLFSTIRNYKYNENSSNVEVI